MNENRTALIVTNEDLEKILPHITYLPSLIGVDDVEVIEDVYDSSEDENEGVANDETDFMNF